MQAVIRDTSNIVYSTPCPPTPKLDGQIIIWNGIMHVYDKIGNRWRQIDNA